MIPVSTLLIALLLAPGDDTSAQPIQIGGKPYRKLGSREETQEAMLEALTPNVGKFGDWYLLSPFEYFGHEKNDIARELPPEVELANMRANGPGPDLKKTWTGKRDTPCTWEKVDAHANEVFDLRRQKERWKNDNATAFLYTTITCDSAHVSAITLGSDDGVKVWLNGRMIHELDAARGLDPTEDKLTLDLQAGVNHLLIKITNGAVNWEFQMNTRRDLAADLDAQLFYQLDKDFPPNREREHYRVMPIPTPDDIVLEVGGLAIRKDGKPLVATRRGDIYLVDGAFDDPPFSAKFIPFATGLHEALGLAVRQDAEGEAIYSTQRGELTRLRDVDGDDRADVYETFCDGWGVSGNYHEFAFGPAFDREGNAFVTLNVGFCGSLGKSPVPYRGWCVKIDRNGNITPWCDGLRSPNGFTFYPDGTLFYVDNQGDYVATNRLSALLPNSWHGHPASLRWRPDFNGEERPPRQPPAVWFPYKKMGQSAADVELCNVKGRFGPFDGQLFVGDQLAATVMRVALEVVDGHHQGACFPFLDGLACGVNRLEFAPDGSLLLGETDRGWTSIGRRRHGLERVVYSGKNPFEMLTMKAQSDGFVLEFTADVDAKSATDPASYTMSSYTYAYHSDYGAPEIETQSLTIQSATLLDPRHVRLVVSPLKRDFVHELRAAGVRATSGEALLHDVAYYTLVNIPGADNRRDDSRLPKTLFLTAAKGVDEEEVAQRPQEATLSRAEIQLTEALRGRSKVKVTKDPSLLTDRLTDYAALCLLSAGDLDVSPQARAHLIDWVRNGGALTVIHTGVDTFPSDPAFQAMLGVKLDRAAGFSKKTTFTANVIDKAHPAALGATETLRFEDRLPRYVRIGNTPLRAILEVDTATLDSSIAKPEAPLAYCREYGRGRIFVTALGHEDELWRDDRFLKHLREGVEWTLHGPDTPTPPPAGASVVLATQGTKLDGFEHRDGTAPKWKIVSDDSGGSIEVANGGGDVVTKESFGDADIHIEFQVPQCPPEAKGQERGNSGVYLMDRYEIQVLDSLGNELGDGDCAGIYGQRPASVNAAREPLRWQTYDIRFTAPRFGTDGKKTSNARVTLYWNGVLVHDDVEITGPTGGAIGSDEVGSGPIRLQDHGHPVRYRNLFVTRR